MANTEQKFPSIKELAIEHGFDERTEEQKARAFAMHLAKTPTEKEGWMKKFAVALYLEKIIFDEPGVQTLMKRLYQDIVEAVNKSEALGKIIGDEKRPLYDFSIVHHIVTEIEND